MGKHMGETTKEFLSRHETDVMIVSPMIWATYQYGDGVVSKDGVLLQRVHLIGEITRLTRLETQQSQTSIK